MRNFIIVKENTGLALFGIQNLNLNYDYRNFLLWSSFLDSFRFDKRVAYTLVFVDHPTEYYIGISVKAEDPDLRERKIQRYMEKLAYHLIYHFPEAQIRILETDECLHLVLNVLNIVDSGGVPPDLAMLDGSRKGLLEAVMGIGKIKTAFVRAIDPEITVDKLFKLYGKHYEENQPTIEERLGVKTLYIQTSYNERILSVLENPLLAYAFSFTPVKRKPPKFEEQFPTLMKMPPEMYKKKEKNPLADFVRKFFDSMSVPDDLVDLVYRAESVADLFNNPYVVLVSPKMAAKLILLPL